MPKTIKKRIAKKPADAEEEVKSKLAHLQDTLKERQKTVLKYGAIILVVVFAVTGFLFYTYSSQKKAKELEYEAYKIYYNVYQKQPLSREEQYRKALDIFKKAYDTRKSPVSLFYIAGCYYELGQYDDALNTLKEFAQRYSNEERFIPLIYQKMAMVYLRKGNINEAINAIDSMYNLKGDIYKDRALIEYARLLEREGKIEEAKKKYKELTTQFPDSAFSDEAKTKLSVEKEG